ncbi:hypothetical protein [Citrobacter rodentium]|jgi:hypothetical protein|uniref:Glycosyltransferase n=2 Tax=Citrobacter rodentium TaxID=67825 RepID=A0A482PN21_CITRO|nr:hypothetical protein [Citrobacter rodentium]WOZ57191.1 hypothetical protein [Citrobacter phage phiNP]KIQ48983.1 hypothetical protein TA05_23255 [Citrobacter rodentium]QBY29090.1 hypothetical protein E2R62_09600 [Citrobacter rodentium]UHO29053.1 hypothetical protein K7R23_13325 [Citrobacter rodentium NBRC 105723 = DSM 16636]CBG89347.1 hypothetical prophage protein [Citrobacter rodentium ICC168]
MRDKPVIATVLRSGGAYAPEHVKWLKRQLPGGYDFVCFSDRAIRGVRTIPLKQSWPGWWSKIELFDPAQCDSDIFFLDLDTVITGDITELLAEQRMGILADFYHPSTVGSAVMRIPHGNKASIWEQFMEAPVRIMQECTQPGKKWGDQGFLDDVFQPRIIWQNEYPGQIVSYKQHIACAGMPGWHSLRSEGNGTLPPDARIVCFHGNPKPWTSNLPWVPAL